MPKQQQGNSATNGAYLLTTAEVAERIGVSASTVLRLAVAGKLPVTHRLPGKTGALLFAEADVDALDEAVA